jgi:NAD(P)-dependent dehydrogenase (short-subunit alcohol dehydrogenase family)
MTGRIEGKVAVITGSTSGIGAATARRFREEGARVVVSGRNRAKGEALVAELGLETAFRACDVAKEEDIAALIGFTVERFGRLDILFNNAGDATAQGGVEQADVPSFRFDMDVLVGGVLFGMKHAAPHMRRQRGGSIVNNASIAGHRSFGNKVYGAAKAAVAHLTRIVAAELAEDNIRVNAVSPGATVTPIFLEVADRTAPDVEQKLERLKTYFATYQPLPIAGMPIDIANAALFLASDEARFITGVDLVVDGGKILGERPREIRAFWEDVEALLRS